MSRIATVGSTNGDTKVAATPSQVKASLGKPKSLARCTVCTEEFYVAWKDKGWVLAK